MMAEQTTRLKIKEQQGISIVEFSDRKILDELCIHEIQEELSILVESRPGVKLLLCFRNVEHLSSAALGMLITLKKKVEEAKGVLKLSNINPQIFEVFKITRLNKIFDIHPTTDKALAAF
jgi:anti-sigma B factor antagonist